ncbi:unnamed protein product [Urochloa humidicola]
MSNLAEPAGDEQAVEETVAGKSHIGSKSMFEGMSSPISPAKALCAGFKIGGSVIIWMGLTIKHLMLRSS